MSILKYDRYSNDTTLTKFRVKITESGVLCFKVSDVFLVKVSEGHR